MSNLKISDEEAAFLLVLLCEEDTIVKRMNELKFPMETINLESLIKRVREISVAAMNYDKDKYSYYAGQAMSMMNTEEEKDKFVQEMRTREKNWEAIERIIN